MSNFDDMKLAVEALTGGKNTVILDDMCMPSIMVRWEPQLISDLITGGSNAVHPGSIVNGTAKAMFISKYQNIIVNDRAYSLPFQDPKTMVAFSSAVIACRSKVTVGGAWQVMPYSLWCQIALWCRKNGTMPRGNNFYGKDQAYAHEKGTPTAYLAPDHPSHPNEPARIATGSGPAAWNHNWLPDGIADLNGNVTEFCAGMRLKNGEIQVIPNADCMDPDVSIDADSSSWKAISAAGVYVALGSASTLKYDWLNSKLTLISGSVADDGSTARTSAYSAIVADSGLTVPEIAKALALYPDEPGGDYGGDARFITLGDTRIPRCGGGYDGANAAGVFCASMNSMLTESGFAIGFRSVFCEL